MMTPDNKPVGACSNLAMKLFSFGRRKDGVVSIEAALLFPVMILLLLGMIDIAQLLSAQRKATNATSAIVDLATQVTNTTNTAELNRFIDAVDSILQPYNISDIKIELFNYRPNGNNVNMEWSHSRGSCGGPPMPTGDLKKLTEEENDILVGRVCLNFRPIVGYVLGAGPIKVEDVVAQRPRQGKTLGCSNC